MQLANESGNFDDYFETYQSNSWGAYPRLFLGDYNGDGTTDLLCLQEDNNSFVQLATGSGNFADYFITHQSNNWGPSPRLYLGDFNGDGRTDLLWLQTDNRSFVQLANESGNFDDYFETYQSNSWGPSPRLDVGDFNGDGKSDLLWLDQSNHSFVQLANGSGNFSAYFETYQSNQWGPNPKLSLGDFNGDGKTDILWLQADNNSFVQLARADGTGNFDAYFMTHQSNSWGQNPALYTTYFWEPIIEPDVDNDGLPDWFESQISDLFTPYYHVSAAERTGTAFGLMGDYVPETPIALHGPMPPHSYYRVKPLGFTINSGVQYGVLRIDYLTLWNRDDGLSASIGCEATETIAFGLAGLAFSELLPVVSSHDLDNERSLMLVSAPTTAPNSYNLNPYGYSAYFYYTAAHEWTIFDQSIAWSLSNWPAGTHPEVALSSGKHSTYLGFNPDGLPLTPSSIIASAYSTLDALYWDGIIDDETYWAYYFGATEAFYSCVVEGFSDRGGAYADVRTNVGEPEHPINGSHFILDSNSGLAQKLQ